MSQIFLIQLNILYLFYLFHQEEFLQNQLLAQLQNSWYYLFHSAYTVYCINSRNTFHHFYQIEFLEICFTFLYKSIQNFIQNCLDNFLYNFLLKLSYCDLQLFPHNRVDLIQNYFCVHSQNFSMFAVDFCFLFQLQAQFFKIWQDLDSINFLEINNFYDVSYLVFDAKRLHQFVFLILNLQIRQGLINTSQDQSRVWQQKSFSLTKPWKLKIQNYDKQNTYVNNKYNLKIIVKYYGCFIFFYLINAISCFQKNFLMNTVWSSGLDWKQKSQDNFQAFRIMQDLQRSIDHFNRINIDTPTFGYATSKQFYFKRNLKQKNEDSEYGRKGCSQRSSVNQIFSDPANQETKQNQGNKQSRKTKISWRAIKRVVWNEYEQREKEKQKQRTGSKLNLFSIRQIKGIVFKDKNKEPILKKVA